MQPEIDASTTVMPVWMNKKALRRGSIYNVENTYLRRLLPVTKIYYNMCNVKQ